MQFFILRKKIAKDSNLVIYIEEAGIRNSIVLHETYKILIIKSYEFTEHFVAAHSIFLWYLLPKSHFSIILKYDWRDDYYRQSRWSSELSYM